MNNVRNFARLAFLLIRGAVVLLTLRRLASRTEESCAAALLVDELIALGPVFVKLGQVLSTRPDLLPESYVIRLATLQDDAPRVDFAIVRGIVEAELGQPLATAFAKFDPAPVAAASLAQVHRARLANGTSVAVKVQRPGLQQLFHRDLDALAIGLRCASVLAPRFLRRTNLVAFFDEFRRYSLAELDFANEAQTMERFRANFGTEANVRIPRIHPDYSTSNVLCMDWVEGMRLAEASATLPKERKEDLVQALVSLLLKMFVSDGLFHADMHPGNIVFHEDGSFTLLDFGMYGELNEAQRDRFILYWMAVAQRQTRRAFHHFAAQTEAMPNANHAAFFDAFEQLAETFYEHPTREASLARTYLAMMRAGYRTGFLFPAQLLLHAKALTTAEALLFVLVPDARFDDLSRPFIAREILGRVAGGDIARRLSQILPEILLLGAPPPLVAIDRSWDWSATQALFDRTRGGGKGLGREALMGLSIHLARPHLGSETDGILAEAWAQYDVLEDDMPLAPNAGAILTTHLAVLTLALHRSLVANGRTVAESHALIFALAWDIYSRWGDPPLELARTITRNKAKRLKIATDLFRRFPFGPPGYGWRDVDAGATTVAFDCTQCPVADFFLGHGEGGLCTATWCALDFPLAEKWGGRLARSKTIAGGADHCDFRWHVAAMPTSETEEMERHDAGRT